jgi:hypothetical protein
MNPSYADDQIADKTVNRIIRASVDHGYSGWIMLNLYPERATKPKELSPYDVKLSAANCAAIAEILTVHGVTEVLGAWGGLAHATIRRAKKDVLAQLSMLGVRLFSLDSPTSGGEPRHPTPRTRLAPFARAEALPDMTRGALAIARTRHRDRSCHDARAACRGSHRYGADSVTLLRLT